ncbi:DUF5050 domain-containing protein [bacterium]|nr:DUF5050 domain-containing protein [bacterium]
MNLAPRIPLTHRLLLLPLALAVAGPASATSRIIWADHHDFGGANIQMREVDSSETTTLITDVGNFAEMVRVDEASGYVYWVAEDNSSVRSIRRARIDGSQKGVLLTADVGLDFEIDPAEGKMYWTDGFGEMYRADLDGTDAEVVVGFPFTALWLELDPLEDAMYWIGPGAVYRSNRDGFGRTLLYSSPAAESLEFDLPSRMLYWTNGDGVLFRGASDGTDGPIGVGTDVAGNFQLDSTGDFVYWAEEVFPTIFHMLRTDLNGQNLTPVGDTLFQISDITLLPSASPLEKVYWAEAANDDIHRSGVDGSSPELLTPADPDPTDLHVDLAAGKVYWLSSQFGIVRSNLDGTQDETVLYFGPFTNTRGLALDAAGGWLYYRDDAEIRRVRADGTDGEGDELVRNDASLQGSGLDVDPGAGHVYWVNNTISSGPIMRSNLDGSGSPVHVVPGAEAEALALDLAGGRVYWAYWGNGQIRRANLDGTSIESVGGGDARHLCVDSDAGKIYYSTYEGDLYRMNPDGTNRRVFAVGGDIRGVALGTMPAFDHKVYWSDLTNDRIRRSNLDGSAVETVLTGVPSPQGIALDPATNKMYWSDPALDVIRRSDLDGTNVEDVVTSGLDYARDLDVDWVGDKVYWVDRGFNRVGRANLDGSGFEILYTGIDDPKGMQLDIGAGKIYWGDNITNRVARGDMDGSGPVETVIPGTPHPYGIALDTANGKIYWTDDVDDTIERANLDGSGREQLHSGLSQPLHLAIDHAAGKIYWAENALKAVMRSNLDGTDLETVASDPGAGMVGIFLTSPGTPTTTAAPEIASRLPIGLSSPFPNPFSTGASLSVTHGGGRLELDVFDVAGRRVTTLERSRLPAGDYAWTWDGRDKRGRRTAPGVYFFRYRADGAEQRTVKGVLLR